MFKTNSNKISTDYLILYTEENRQDAINLASELKREGYVVECDTSIDIATHIKSAEIRNIKEILKITDSDVSVIDVGDNRMTKMKTNQFLNSLNDREVVVPIH